MKVRVTQQDTEHTGVETPCLLLVSELNGDPTIYYVDSDAFNPDSMPMRDRALLSAFVELAAKKLGWEINDVARED